MEKPLWIGIRHFRLGIVVVQLLCDSTMVIMYIYAEEITILYYKRVCVWIFIAALFIMSQEQKQLEVLQTSEWLNKLCYLIP
jgi:hypothetical protein